jgi:hypothetical protein
MSLNNGNNNHMEALQTMITQMQDRLQLQLQQQQRDFEVRVESLIIGKGKGTDPANSMPPASGPSAQPTPPSVPSFAPKESQSIDDPQTGPSSNIPAFQHPIQESTMNRPRESPYVRQPSYPTSYTQNPAYSVSSSQSHATKVKASDLPKFKGDKTEDVEVWIEQVSAIFEANMCSNSEIVAFLSVILKDNALKWFTRLGPKGRSQYPTWTHWQEALRQRFLKANYLAEKKRMWKKRDLRANEDMADYFDAKVDLQAFVFDGNTPESELILDILDGLPDYMLPTLKSSITPDMDLSDFRRILLDYEKGLRWNGPYGSRGQNNHQFPRSNAPGNDRAKPQNNGKDKDVTKLPSRPCSCGGMHWYRDCPKKNAKSNNVSSSRSNPNRIPINQSKWPSQSNGPKNSGSQQDSKHDDGTSASDALPVQDNEGYDELYETLCNNTRSPEQEEQHRHADKVPTFAMAKIGSQDGATHPVCIDTGSAISLIDSNYLRKNFPSIKVNASSTIMLRGVGSNQTHGWMKTDIHFVNDNRGYTSISGVFHVVTSLATKIIIGNDVLIEEGAVIDLTASTCPFKTSSGNVPITSLKSRPDSMLIPSARLQAVYNIKPGYQARVPIALTSTPSTELYLLSPVKVSDDIEVSRTFGTTKGDQHYVHVMNVGNNIVKLPSNLVLATIVPVRQTENGMVESNNTIQEDSIDDREAFEEALGDIDINIELSDEERDLLRDTIRRNRSAFSYGSKRLGRTNETIMSIETGNAPPISQAPYRASPEGRKIIDETLAELLADDVIEESDSPWASPAILVRQKGKDRFCIDYRKINDVTKADQYPIPRIDDILSQFAGKAYFSTFDANKGFHQIEIAPEDREKTAFRKHRGLHQYKRMPFGLKNGPSVF